MPRAVLAVLSFLLVLCACASHQPKENRFIGFYKGYDTCRAEIAEVDARIAKAQVGNAEYFRPPGFPYFRTDRTLASLRHELRDQDAIWEWTRRMRELDMEAREYELMALNLDDFDYAVLRDRMQNCGRVLADVETRDKEDWERLLEVVQPDDDYSGVSRKLGVYSLTASRRQARIVASRDAWTAGYGAALPPAADSATLKTWTPKHFDDLDLGTVPSLLEVNNLGYPGLVGSGWRAVAQDYAPTLWSETRGAYDGPAALQYGKQGLQADPSTPVVYYQLGYTRFGGHMLIQVSYYLYFSAAEGAKTAPVDGMVWRVTFDPALHPLVYESLHGSGRDHRWYPVQPLTPRPAAPGDEPQFIAPVPAPGSDAALRVSSGTHAVQRVVAAAAAQSSATGQYELRPYEDLYKLRTVDGKLRSAFAPDGTVWNSKGVDPEGGFSSGIKNAGAIRQAGHYPIAHVGKRQFDDHDILAAAFVAPDWPPPELPAPVTDATMGLQQQ